MFRVCSFAATRAATSPDITRGEGAGVFRSEICPEKTEVSRRRLELLVFVDCMPNAWSLGGGFRRGTGCCLPSRGISWTLFCETSMVTPPEGLLVEPVPFFVIVVVGIFVVIVLFLLEAEELVLRNPFLNPKEEEEDFGLDLAFFAPPPPRGFAGFFRPPFALLDSSSSIRASSSNRLAIRSYSSSETTFCVGV